MMEEVCPQAVHLAFPWLSFLFCKFEMIVPASIRFSQLLGGIKAMCEKIFLVNVKLCGSVAEIHSYYSDHPSTQSIVDRRDCLQSPFYKVPQILLTKM